jgi:hypothetical protein
MVTDRPPATPALYRIVTRKGRRGWAERSALRVAAKSERDALKSALKARTKARDKQNAAV